MVGGGWCVVGGGWWVDGGRGMRDVSNNTNQIPVLIIFY